MGQPGFFDVDDRLKRLSNLGDQLETYSKVVDFEIFRSDLGTALQYSDGLKGGRPAFDVVMMFKILVIQTQNNLSDERVEFLINDRLSFMRFLGLGLQDKVPDARTIWLFREKLTKANALKTLFNRFDHHLRERGYLAMSGQIVDASLVAAPRQHITDEEKKEIKEGRIPTDWKTKIAKLRHKDRDARWTVKQGRKRKGDQLQIAIPHYGYKSHISADRKFKLIRRWTVTDAATHDSRMLPHILDKSNTASLVWADTAYRSQKNETFIEMNGFTSCVHRKKAKGKPKPTATRKSNKTKSKIRCHIEHIFAEQKERMDLFIRTIGLERATTKIGLANILYNIRRLSWLEARMLA